MVSRQAGNLQRIVHTISSMENVPNLPITGLVAGLGGLETVAVHNWFVDPMDEDVMDVNQFWDNPPWANDFPALPPFENGPPVFNFIPYVPEWMLIDAGLLLNLGLLLEEPVARGNSPG